MNPSVNLDQAISGASLVLAVLAALYTLWLGEVNRALELDPEPDTTNRASQQDQVWSALFTKGLPLFAASLAAACVMSWRTYLIVAECFAHWRAWDYDDVKALFVLTSVLLFTIFMAAAAQAWCLFKKGLDLRE